MRVVDIQKKLQEVEKRLQELEGGACIHGPSCPVCRQRSPR